MFNFGIPRAPRSTKIEQFAFPALTLLARAPDALKTNFKFVLNNQAIQAMGLTAPTGNRVAFAFQPDVMIISNVTSMELPKDVQRPVSKAGVFASKAYHDYIISTNFLDQTVDNTFRLVRGENADGTVFFILELAEEDTTLVMSDSEDTEEVIETAEMDLSMEATS